MTQPKDDKDIIKLWRRIAKALGHKKHDEVMTASEAGITCDLCNDAAWWPENGFTPEERQAACGPTGINCPGFGGGPGGGG